MYTLAGLARWATVVAFRSTSSGRFCSWRSTARGLSGPVPQQEDVVAVTNRKLIDIDICDERSLAAAVRDAVAAAQPVTRAGR